MWGEGGVFITLSATVCLTLSACTCTFLREGYKREGRLHVALSPQHTHTTVCILLFVALYMCVL